LLAAGKFAEQIVENVGERRGEIERIAVASSVSLFERGVTETIVSGALLIVFQDVVGFVDFLEFHFGGVVVGILVGMQLHRELAIGGLELADRRTLLAVQDVVVIALRHRPAE